MKKSCTLTGIAAAICLLYPSLTVNAANLGTPTWTPPQTTDQYGDGPFYATGEITQITATWADATDLELTDSAVITYSDNMNYWDMNSGFDLKNFVSFEGNKMIITYTLQAETQQMQYTIYVKEGSVKDKTTGNTNAYAQAFYVVNPPSIDVDNLVSEPPFGSGIVSFGPTVTYSVPGYSMESTWEYNPYAYEDVKIKGPSDSSYKNIGSNNNLVIEDGKLKVTFPSTYTAIGQYEVKFGQNILQASNTEGETLKNVQDLVLYYNVTGYLAEPASFSTINWPLESFSIFGNSSVTCSNYSGIKIKIDSKEVGSVTSTTAVDNGLQFNVTINEGIDSNKETLTITIPANTLTIDGKAYTSGITLEYYTKMELPEPTVAPVSGSELGALSFVSVNWKKEAMNEGTGSILLQYEDEEPVNVTRYFSFEKEDSGTDAGMLNVAIDLDFSANPFIQAGTYKLTIPAGFVYVSAFESYNKDVEITYTVKPNYLGEPTVSPDNESLLESLESVSFEWTTADDVVLTQNTELELSVLKGGQPYEGEFTVDFADNVLTVEFAEEITEKGNYTVILPEGYLFTLVGENSALVNGPKEVTFQIGQPDPEIGALAEQPVISPDPEDGAVKSLSTIVLTWYGYELAENEFAVPATFNSEVVVAEFAGETITFTVEANANGTYLLDVPNEYAIATDENGSYYTPAVLVTFTVEATDGVSVIPAAADGLYHVYNVQGVNVLNTKNGADLKNLAKGVYIVNGKKVVLK